MAANNKQALAAFFERNKVDRNRVDRNRVDRNRTESNSAEKKQRNIHGTDEPSEANGPAPLQVAGLFSPPQDIPLAGKAPARLDFSAFSQSEIWRLQNAYYQQQGPAVWQQNQVPHYITSTPSLVKAYAHILVHFVMDGLQNGAIDPRQPIYLLELGAGSGRFAIQLLQQLEVITRQYGLAELELCYLLSDFSEKNCAFMAAHPYLQHDLAAGRAKVIHYNVLPKNAVLDAKVDATESEVAEVTDITSVLSGTNPPIVLANYVLDSLPQELLYLHYGELYQGEVAIDTEHELDDIQSQQDQQESEQQSQEQCQEKEQAETQLYYRWQKQPSIAHWLKSQPKALRAELSHQLDYYTSRLHSLPLMLPTGALACLHNLQQSLPQGMMLLSADFGQNQLSELGDTLLSNTSVPSTWNRQHFSQPVNFHSVNLWLGRQQALVRSIKHRGKGLVFNLAITLGTHTAVSDKAWPLTYQACENSLLDYNPDDFFVIKRSLHGAREVLSEAQQQAYIRLSEYDPKVLALFLPNLLSQGVPVDNRLDWCALLSKVWQVYVPIGEQGDFAFQLGLLAIDLSHWGLAKACFISCLHWYGESTAVLHNLALCAQATTEDELALKTSGYALELNPDDKQVQQLAQTINNGQAQAKLCPYYFCPPDSDADLALRPLAAHHGAEFYLQYRHLHTAAMVRGLALTSLTQVQSAITQWQQEAEQSQSMHYGVIHADLGLVGVTALEFNFVKPEQRLKTGHFSFWIGTDYQGKGFGRQAVEFSIEQARAITQPHPLDALITSVWQHNCASIRILEKLGFVPLDVTKGQGAEQELFYALPFSNNDIANTDTPERRIAQIKQQISQQILQESTEKTT